MKSLLCLTLCVFLISCHTTEGRNQKIKQALINSLSTGLDKNKMQVLDSISITKIDSLTEKAKLFLEVKFYKERADDFKGYYENRLDVLKQSRISLDFEKRYNSTSMIEYYEERITEDSAQAKDYYDRYLKFKTGYDSLRVLYNNSDGIKHWGYAVETNIYYSVEFEKDTLREGYFITKDYKLVDTTNQLLKYLSDMEKLRKDLKKISDEYEAKRNKI